MKLKSQEYTRLFHHKGFRFLINDIWIRAYKGYRGVAIVKDDDYMGFMHNKMVQKALNEGLEIFKSKEKFDNYFNNFIKFQEDFLNLCKNLLSSSELTKTRLKKFFASCIKSISLYKRTEFIFTDKAYEEAQKTDNLILKRNIEKFAHIKNKSRKFLNSVFIGKESYSHLILEKISKKFDITTDDLLQYNYSEILDLYEGNKVIKEVLKTRFHANLVVDDGGTIKIFWGKEAEIIFNGFLKRYHTKQISGTAANPGKAIGHARIIRPGYDDFDKVEEIMKKMNRGNILVSETTSPELMPAIKKARAIVTDQGGLLSHAAIMSREFKIPCIVGTGNATDVLKDGDFIEVDADKGVVRRIKGK